MKLENKVIVITGSTRGIGRAIAEACAREGGKIIICSRNSASVKEASESFIKRGLKVAGITVDVSSEDDLKKLFGFSIEKFGTIDVWINNAGLSGGYRMIYDLNDTEIRDIVNVNITGMLLACKMIIPYFLKNNKGIILNMSGRGGRGETVPYMTPYAATKAAVTSLTKCLAKEYKDKPLSIHSILPGMVETDFYRDIKTSPNLKDEAKNIPLILKAFGVPKEEVGEAVVNIATQEPGKTTGKHYSLMGGKRGMKAIFTMMRYRMTGKMK